MKKSILIVEDEKDLGQLILKKLLDINYNAILARNSSEAIVNINANKFDLILIDLGLPDLSGFDLAKQIFSKIKVPFIFMTAQNTAENRLLGFELGAHDFIPKPFHFKELQLRLEHIFDNHTNQLELINLPTGELDLIQMCFTNKHNSTTFFAIKDFKILKLLISKKPQAVSRDEILDCVWGEDKFPSQRSIDNSIVRLREILNDPNGEIIRSVRSVGYQWVLVKENLKE
jgi:DNA-binding response OmpR family regulator